jgi:hypothetical protein
MAEKILNPLGAEAFGLQKPGDGMTKEMGIEMREAGIGIGDPGFDTNRLDNVVNRPRGHLPVPVTQKDWPGFAMADENEEIAEVFVVDDRNDPGFTAFALLNRHAFAFNIEIPDIELEEFATANAQPPERFDQTTIPKIGRGQE